MALGHRIKQVREELKLSQPQLSARTKGRVSQTTLASIESRDSANSAAAPLLAEALGINLAWALTGEGPKWAARAEVVLESPVSAYHPEDAAGDAEIRIPEYRVSFRGGSAGSVVPQFDEVMASEPAVYRASWFQKERINPKRCKRFRVTGTSMEPLLYPNDCILVNEDEKQVREGLIYVFRQGEELKVKKLIPRADGSLVLRSINREEYPDDVLPPDLVAEQITIIGRVRDKSGRGGL